MAEALTMLKGISTAWFSLLSSSTGLLSDLCNIFSVDGCAAGAEIGFIVNDRMKNEAFLDPTNLRFEIYYNFDLISTVL